VRGFYLLSAKINRNEVPYAPFNQPLPNPFKLDGSIIGNYPLYFIQADLLHIVVLTVLRPTPFIPAMVWVK
jgi:hypothetical protein